MSESIEPRSDQMNAEDLLPGPRTFTIDDVRVGMSPEQPVSVFFAEFPRGRPFKPSKTVRRIMVVAWGLDSDPYVGHQMTLFRDPSVRFAGQDVGGIRVSHMSHIPATLNLMLAVTRGKRAPYVVEPIAALPGEPATTGRAAKPLQDRIAAMIDRYHTDFGVTVRQLAEHLKKSQADWTVADVDLLGIVFKSLTDRTLTVADAFVDPVITMAEITGAEPAGELSDADLDPWRDEPDAPAAP